MTNQERALKYLQEVSEFIVYGQKKYKGKEVIAAGKIDNIINKLCWLEEYVKKEKEVENGRSNFEDNNS
jgi:hypothetical protein